MAGPGASIGTADLDANAFLIPQAVLASGQPFSLVPGATWDIAEASDHTLAAGEPITGAAYPGTFSLASQWPFQALQGISWPAIDLPQGPAAISPQSTAYLVESCDAVECTATAWVESDATGLWAFHLPGNSGPLNWSPTDTIHFIPNSAPSGPLERIPEMSTSVCPQIIEFMDSPGLVFAP